MPKLENWCLHRKIDRPDRQYLAGNVYGHPSCYDGENISTSHILHIIDHQTVRTASGNTYSLGEPDPKFVEWCKEQGKHIPAADCKIKITDVTLIPFDREGACKN